ncbi:MAG: PEP-CTERM sorting domain-containing protein [Lacipirellulaceae bacterium]
MSLHRVALATGALALTMAGGGAAQAYSPILAPGDSILSIDLDVNSRSFYPAGEPPAALFDASTGSKYLNFGQRNSGFIVTPTALSSVGSFQITTANDSPERDPRLWEVYGTNSPITSADNSAGDAEPWTLVGAGSVTLPNAREALGPAVSIPAGPAYSSYRVVFPSLRNDIDANSLQLAKFGLFASVDATGPDLLSPTTPVIAIHRPTSESRYPGGEGPANLLDGNTNSKFLNFGRTNVGVIVTPAAGASVLEGFAITTANDEPARDPTSYKLWGTNDPVTSTNNSGVDGSEVWTLISQGALALPGARQTSTGVIPVANATSYTAYRIEFPTFVGPANDFPGNSLQISELQFYTVPEPSTALSIGLGALALGVLRRRGC